MSIASFSGTVNVPGNAGGSVVYTSSAQPNLQSQQYAQFLQKFSMPNILSDEQLDKLTQLKYSNGMLLFNIKMGQDYDTLYNILQMIMDYGYNKTYEYLTSKPWLTPDDIFFGLPYFNTSKENTNRSNERYHDILEIGVGFAICKICKGFNTIPTQEKQTKASDESSQIKLQCLDCNRSFDI